MKFNLNTAFCFLIALPLLFASCSKQGPAGPTGPAGAQGPAGTAGAAGAAGATGAQGTTGTANVIYSAWLDVGFAPLVDSTTGDTTAFRAAIPAPQLVDSILNNGVMKVYLNLYNSDSSEVVSLPFTTTSGVLINPIFVNGAIILDANTGGAGTYTYSGDGKKYQQYRYVLIPGGTAAGRNPKGAINWNNYAEVKRYLGLKD